MLAAYRITAVDLKGNVIPFANVEVFKMEVGFPPAQVFADAAGAVSLGSSFKADEHGKVRLYALGGLYRVRTWLIIDGVLHENIDDDVAIGNLQGYDFGQDGLLKFEWDEVVPDLAGRDDFDGAGKGFSVYVEVDSSKGGFSGVYYKVSDADAAWSAGAIAPAIVVPDGFIQQFTISGRPLPGEFFLGHDFTDQITFASDLDGSRAKARIAATAESVFSITLDDVEVGTLTFAAASDVGVFASASGFVGLPGNVLDMLAPDPRDDTLSDIRITLRGTR